LGYFVAISRALIEFIEQVMKIFSSYRNIPLVLCALFALHCASEGTKSGADEGPGTSAGPFEVQKLTFGFDSSRLLSSLSEQELGVACENLSRVVTDADEKVSCQVVATGEHATTSACTDSLNDCIVSPNDVLSKTSIRSTPAAIDCSAFNTQLTGSCDVEAVALEECINAMASRVLPAAEAVSCANAETFSSVAGAEGTDKAAQLNAGTDYVIKCVGLLGCKELIAALTTPNPSAMGGAGGMN